MSVIAIENNARATTASPVTHRRNYNIATPSQQTGYEATFLSDELDSKRWRAATADVNHTPHLVRYDRPYRIGARSLATHNLSPTASYKIIDDTLAVRPMWTAEGGTDFADTTTESIDAPTDFAIFLDVHLPPQSTDLNTVSVPILRFFNTADGDLLRIVIRERDAGSAEGCIAAQVFNYQSIGSAATLLSTYRASGSHVRIGYRYRNSDQRAELWINGALASSGTGSAALTGSEGDLRCILGVLSGNNAVCGYKDVVIFSHYPTDTAMAGYAHPILDGTERGLLAGWHFTEGTGTTVADSTGNASLTLSGGTWSEDENRHALYSTGHTSARGRWYGRDALELAHNTHIQTPSLGNAVADMTLSFLIELDATEHAPSSASNDSVIALSPTGSDTDAELLIELDSSGVISVTSNRDGTPATITSAATIRGTGVRQVRVTLESQTNTQSTLALYLDEISEGTATVGDFDDSGPHVLRIGAPSAGTDNATCRLSDVRLFGALRTGTATTATNADSLDDLVDLSDLSLIEALRLDGEVVSDVDSSRSMTVNSAAYATIINPKTTAANTAGRQGLGWPFKDQRDSADHLDDSTLDITSTADVLASETYIQVWDRKNGDGYVSAGALYSWSTFRPAKNRVSGASRGFKPATGLRSKQTGYPYLADEFEAMTGAIELKYLINETESDEVYRRLVRYPRDLTVCLIINPTVAEFPSIKSVANATSSQLLDRAVIGTLQKTERVTETGSNFCKLQIEVLGL